MTQPDPLRVDYVISGLGTGGAEMMLFKLLEHGPRLRAGRVIALNGGGEMVDRLRGIGVPVTCLGMRSSAPSPVVMGTLVRLLRRDRPDVVSTWMYHADLLGGVAARFLSIPVVWGIRNSTLGAQTRTTTRMVVRLCAQLSRRVPARIISCSSRARAVHEALGYDPAKFVVVPNGFDLARFHPSLSARTSVRVELGIPENAPVVGLVARFDAQKDHAGFLRAAALVHARRPDVHFVLVGSGVTPGNLHLTSAVEASKLGAAVSLLGPRADVPRLMAAFDTLVSSSLYGEAFPNVLGEAMACGVPCVVTDVGDSAEIVCDTGFVVPPGQPHALAERILDVVGLPHSDHARMGERARQRVAAHFSIQYVAARYEEVFDQAARTAQRASNVATTEDAR